MRKGIIYVYFNRAKYEKEGIEKYYVGQTVKAMEQRAGKNGRNYGCTDPNCNSKFARSIRKWGWDAFEGRVLEEVYEEDLDELEKFYIEYFDSFKNGYNSTLGGEGTRGHNNFANKTEEEMKEIKEKLSIASKKAMKNPKTREKIGKANKKLWEDKEYREKMSKAQSGKNNAMYGKNAEDYMTPEAITIKREKLSKMSSGEKSGRARSVYCKELNIIFSYVKLAEKYCRNVLNSKIRQIGDVCNGKLKFTGKLIDGTKLTWKWVEDVDKETLNNAEYIDSKKYEEIIQAKLNENK